MCIDTFLLIYMLVIYQPCKYEPALLRARYFIASFAVTQLDLPSVPCLENNICKDIAQRYGVMLKIGRGYIFENVLFCSHVIYLT